ncbi:MAG TPA: DUF3105 domain-containing protein [Nocardioidaceae bacterium]
MAKPNKDRRAVVEQMRREQERAEKKRTLAIIAGAVAVGLLIVGFAAYPLIVNDRQANALAGKELTALGVSADAARCTDVKVDKATGNSDHRPEGSKLSYPDSPPATGPHYPIPAPISRKYYTSKDRPPLGYLVHNLEHGYNILWYDDTVAKDDKQLAVVKAISDKFSGSTLEDKFIAAPWTSDDGDPFPGGAHVALTHWSMGGTNGNPKGQHGITQYCAQPSGDAVATFVKDYPYTDSPEPGAS